MKEGREGHGHRGLFEGMGDGRGEIVEDTAAEAGEVFAIFDLAADGIHGVMEFDLEPDEAGDDDAGIAECAESAGLRFQGERARFAHGSQCASEEQAEEVDLAGEVVKGDSSEHVAFDMGEVAAVEGGWCGRSFRRWRVGGRWRSHGSPWNGSWRIGYGWYL